ncbi:hypothetical protein RI129_006018 [Pyrocoelia pectoralis]|uniref:xanthine dehydrogenase n=1 Tax=Pyrocoelia pectoralis TaxID=417401 RepID=A0AAN7VGA1_9COLE
MSLVKHTQDFPLVFFVNGRKIIEKEVDPEWTLLYYLRNKLQLCGTKHGCGEGGCGACTVMVSKYDRIQDKLTHLAVNACLAPICSMHGLAVTTVEGIGSTKTKLHPVQEAIAKSHGSQCGFCTPGIVMSMYALLRSASKKPSLKDLEITFQGNLCRCTGYRPILDGFKTFTEEWELIQNSNVPNGNCSMGSKCCKLQNAKAEDNICNYTANDYTPYDVTQEPIFPPELKLHKDLDEQYLIFRGKEVTWYRPTQLNELLELKNQFPDAKIVVGNTEIGVETKFKHFSYPIRIYPLLINELTTVTIEKFGIRVGAAVTLQDMSKALNTVIISEMEHRTRIFNAIVEMLHWFAGQQIRNVATVGGNIMTGSPISDLNPIFVAAKVELELDSKSNGRRMVIMDENFFTSYRCNIVRKDEILVAIHIPFTMQYQHFFAYKQARRRDDDTAIVNCAINATFKPKTDIISKIQMAFGGMGPTIVVPKKTCANLINRPWDEATLEEAYEMLINDLPLLPSAPGGMTQYRRSLTLSFFFKAYLAILPTLKSYCPNTEIRKNYTSAIDGFFPQTPKASQYYQITSHNEKVNSLGKPLPHLSSFKQAAGEAIYCDDIPLHQSELHLAFVLSTRPYAKFETDASDALRMEGVKLFISAEDISKDRNSFNGPDTEPYFAPGITTSHGQILGAVVAINRMLAQKAARKVKVTYEDLHPVVITIEDAITHTSFFDQPIIFEEGNVDEVFATAPHILKGDCRNGAQEHFYLEPHSAIVVPRNEDDEMEIICTAQDSTSISKSVASVLNVSENKIVTKVKRLGGGFGGKEYPVLFLAVSAAIAASRLGVPVRCVLERDEDMLITGARHPFYTKYKCAFNSDGKILGCEAFIYSNAGYAKTASVGVLEQALLKFDGAYNIPNVRLIGRMCKTNLPSNTAFRGFGAPQALLAGEFMIREIAEYLNKDVIEVAKLNLYKEGDITFAGQNVYNLLILNNEEKK